MPRDRPRADDNIFFIEVVNEGTRQPDPPPEIEVARWVKVVSVGGPILIGLWLVWPWLT